MWTKKAEASRQCYDKRDMSYRRSKPLLPWLGLIVLAAALRLPLLFGLGSLWNDEAFSRHFALMPLARSLGYMTMDVHPPLHLVILHFWIGLFGASAAAMRAMSLVFALLGLAAFLKLARALYGKKEALLTGFMFCLMPLMVYYGVDARMYALLFCLSCLSGWLFWRVAQGEEKAKEAWMWVSLALALTHITGALVLAGQGLYLLISRDRRPLFWRLLWRFLAIAAVFCVWFVPAASFRLQSIQKEWQFRSGQESVGAPLSMLYWVWLGNGQVQRALAFLVTGLLVLAGVLRRSERRPHVSVPASSVFMLCWFAAAFLPFLFFPNVSPRYLMAAVPPFFLLLAHGFLKAMEGKRYALVLGVALIAFFAFPGLAAQYAVRSYNWDKSAQWIADHRQGGDRVVFGWYADAYAFESLPDPKLAALAGEAKGLYPFDDQLDPDARYAAHAGTLAITPQDLDRMLPYFDGAPRVFFIPNFYLTMSGGERADLAVAAWLNAHGWFLADRLPPEGRTPGVWLLEKKN